MEPIQIQNSPEAPELAMRADFIGNIIIITKMTTSIEIRRSLRKEKTELLTTCGWSLIMLRLTLSGRVEEKESSTLSTSFPNATILLSGRISRFRMRHGCPL